MALIDLKDARKKRLIEAMLSRETPDGSKQYCFSVVYTMADGASLRGLISLASRVACSPRDRLLRGGAAAL